MPENYKEISYIFSINGELTKKVNVRLSVPKLDYINPIECDIPEWAGLDYKRCEVCRLSEEAIYCPIAKNMVPIIREFGEYISYNSVDLTIKTKEREFHNKVTMQDGLSSLFGIIMTTSGCPTLDKLRPMVYTHLPFATGNETTYRVLSMYVLAQYYRKKEGLEADVDLSGLVELYKEIGKINSTFIERFRGHGNTSDAHLNALVRLSCFNFYIISTIEDDLITDLKDLFHMYLV
ncbi:MAG: DUF6901 family protein [Candidatus Muiribacteriaceae bacterium]